MLFMRTSLKPKRFYSVKENPQADFADRNLISFQRANTNNYTTKGAAIPPRH